MKILVVDDVPSIAFLASALLTELGYDSEIVHNGSDAINFLRNNEDVEMILMDVEMPDMNGIETTQKIREEFSNRWIPIIFLSGRTEDQDIEKGIECGGDDYLVKPVNPVILKAKISAMQRILDMKKELIRLNDELEKMSVTDQLTGIMNRRGFDSYVADQWRNAARKDYPISLILLDIDFFKLFNDNYGHLKGDTCIRSVAQAIHNSLNRPMDKAARFGGEEFIVVLPDTDLDGAQIVAEAIQKSIQGLEIRHALSSVDPHVTCSIGISTSYTPNIQTYAELASAADDALYQSKENGRNRISKKNLGIRKKVMVFDDNQIDLDLTRAVLEEEVDVYTFDSGVECVRRAREIKPDLILLDVIMDQMDGYTACKMLKSDKTTSNIPVLFLSALDPNKVKEKAKGLRANGFISKPYSAETLLAKVKQFVP